MRLASMVGPAALAACAVVPPPVEPPPPPPPSAPPAPTPPPPPVAVAPDKPWDVAPLTPGDWRYEKLGSDSIASFGGPSGSRVAVLRCDRASRQIGFSVDGAAVTQAVVVTIRTTSGTLTWSGSAGAGNAPLITVSRPASDKGFDWIAYSRGRVSVEIQGLQRLILPIWAEVSRVLEDCRG